MLEVVRVSKRVKESQWVGEVFEAGGKESCPLTSFILTDFESRYIRARCIYMAILFCSPSKKPLETPRVPPLIHHFVASCGMVLAVLRRYPVPVWEADDQSVSPLWARGQRPGGGCGVVKTTPRVHTLGQRDAYRLPASCSVLCLLNEQSCFLSTHKPNCLKLQPSTLSSDLHSMT